MIEVISRDNNWRVPVTHFYNPSYSRGEEIRNIVV
jgi:hypothetical protein